MFSMQKHVHMCLAHCSINRNFVMFILFVLFSTCTPSSGIGDVIWAVNSGGEAHTDVHGIRYKADKLDVGIESDYGKTLSIGRVVHQDQILYQTERYHMSNFGYEIPIKEDGDYVLVLKFCEVWFTSPNKKVFDVVLNRDITVVDSLDIFTKVGRGVAHDEIVPFSIVNGNLKVNDEISRMEGKLLVEFVKGEYDNPKINAIYVMKGTVDDVPKLPAIPGSESQKDEEEEEEEEANESKSSKVRRPSGPKVLDPYSADDTSTILLPVFVAVGAFVPLLFCLCKL